MKGIDVSKWQGDIDWQKVKNSGINFAIIKAGGSDVGFYTDPKFELNYAGAKAAGINVGAYYFVGSKCISYEDGAADARRFAKIIQGKTFEYPVYIDLETTSIADKAGATQACIGFCKTMEEHGYFAGIYASDLFGFQDRLELDKLSAYSKWVASYGIKPRYVKDYGIWQSSSTGKVDGIIGNVDMNESLIDFPMIIKANGFNGFAENDSKPVEDSIDWKAKATNLEDKLNKISDIVNE